MNEQARTQVVKLLRYAQTSIDNGLYSETGQPDILAAIRGEPSTDISDDVRRQAINAVVSKMAPYRDPVAFIYGNASNVTRKVFDTALAEPGANPNSPIDLAAVQDWVADWLDKTVIANLPAATA